MKALILEAKDKLLVREVPDPIATYDETTISVELAGIGGSEYLGLANPGIRPLPHAMGHGIVGRHPNGALVAIYPLQGCGHCSYCESDHEQLCDEWSLIGVHSDGGFQQQLAVPDKAIVELPATLSVQQSAFVEPFANAVNAWEIASPQQGESIAVIGAGGLGLGIVACGVKSEISDISISDWSRPRRDAAKELGAKHAADSLVGTYDVVFETVGSEISRESAIALTKKGRECIFLGFATATQPVNFIELIRYQKRLLGSFVYSRKQFRKAIELAHLCKNEWVTEVPFEQVEGHLVKFQNGDFEVVKLALNPTKRKSHN